MSKNINWFDFNYPPALRIVHINIKELDEDKRTSASFSHFTFLTTVAAICFNLFTNLILMFGLRDFQPKGWFLFISSFLIAIMVLPLGLYLFYSCFRALAFSCSSRALKYILLQTAVNVLYILFATSSFRNFQGFSNWSRAGLSNMSVFWRLTTIIESSIWIITFVLSVISCILVYRCQLSSRVKVAKSAVALRNIL
ncbi:hypothetical protein RCL1_004414 [Eukaryota sp. TZLM3-RCL]